MFTFRANKNEQTEPDIKSDMSSDKQTQKPEKLLIEYPKLHINGQFEGITVIYNREINVILHIYIDIGFN
ncbi:MAG TPA: hypothetical protein DER09_03010 [Prolixibacteraceae bacterium]|nr:hypothetical protein [Prolixibacteraceae bacterium]